MAERPEPPTLDEAIEALRALNSGIWLDYPKWAAASPRTGRASEVIIKYDMARRHTPQRPVVPGPAPARPPQPGQPEFDLLHDELLDGPG